MGEKVREKVTLGGSLVNAGALRDLRFAWRAKRLVLFLGAGVSAAHGIPGWRDLVLELLFCQVAESRKMGGILPHYRRALSRWLTEYFDYDLTILARVVRRDLESRRRRHGESPEGAFLEMVRARLYDSYRARRRRRGNGGAAGKRTTLDAVVDLVVRAQAQRNVGAVVTFNFDDLLEQALVARGVRHHVVASAARESGGGLPVIHPHGFLPMQPRPGEEQHPIVFTESEYHALADVAFHWAPTTILSYLRNCTVLFIGLSMSDPHLRRMLDASHVAGSIPPHWQVQKRHEVRDHEQARAVQQIEEYARSYARAVGVPETKKPAEMEEALDATLRQADSYDRELLESMGVKTILLSDYADLVPLLDAIPNGATTAMARARTPAAARTRRAPSAPRASRATTGTRAR